MDQMDQPLKKVLEENSGLMNAYLMNVSRIKLQDSLHKGDLRHQLLIKNTMKRLKEMKGEAKTPQMRKQWMEAALHEATNAYLQRLKMVQAPALDAPKDLRTLIGHKRRREVWIQDVPNRARESPEPKRFKPNGGEPQEPINFEEILQWLNLDPAADDWHVNVIAERIEEQYGTSSDMDTKE